MTIYTIYCYCVSHKGQRAWFFIQIVAPRTVCAPFCYVSLLLNQCFQHSLDGFSCAPWSKPALSMHRLIVRLETRKSKLSSPNPHASLPRSITKVAVSLLVSVCVRFACERENSDCFVVHRHATVLVPLSNPSTVAGLLVEILIMPRVVWCVVPPD